VDIAQLIADFGFPVVMVVGLGYFVYFIWTTVTEEIEPALEEMKATIIRLTDSLRLLDQDQIRLNTKLQTVLELREKEMQNETAESKDKKQKGVRRVD
jgi:hypothetical protein